MARSENSRKVSSTSKFCHSKAVFKTTRSISWNRPKSDWHKDAAFGWNRCMEFKRSSWQVCHWLLMLNATSSSSHQLLIKRTAPVWNKTAYQIGKLEGFKHSCFRSMTIQCEGISSTSKSTKVPIEPSEISCSTHTCY